jgi:hypothetical protein
MADVEPMKKAEESPVPEVEGAAPAEQMCCDGKRTATEHRHESSDGKCCSDS